MNVFYCIKIKIYTIDNEVNLMTGSLFQQFIYVIQVHYK